MNLCWIQANGIGGELKQEGLLGRENIEQGVPRDNPEMIELDPWEVRVCEQGSAP